MADATLDELEANLDRVRAAPAANGTVELIVRRPAENRRETLEEAHLDLAEGLVGDGWASRPSSRRFGVDVLKLVNSEQGRALRLRGLNARVVTPGPVRRGDRVTKSSAR